MNNRSTKACRANESRVMIEIKTFVLIFTIGENKHIKVLAVIISKFYELQAAQII